MILKPSVIFRSVIDRFRDTEPTPAPAPEPPRRLRTAESEAVYIDDVGGEDIEVNEFVDHALVEASPITETEIEIVEDTDVITTVIPRARLERLLHASGSRW